MTSRTPLIGAMCAPAIVLLLCASAVRADRTRDYHCEVFYPVDGSPPRFVVTTFPQLPDGGGGIAGAVAYRNDVLFVPSAYFNPGVAPPGPANYIIFDDVPIPDSELDNATSIAVTKVTVGIRRAPAPGQATDVTAYWTTMTSGTGGGDTALDQPPHLIGIQHLNAPTAAVSTTEIISFGAGTDPIFTAPLNGSIINGPNGESMSSFLIGLQLSNPTTSNGWRCTNGPDANVDLYWRLNPNTGVEHTAIFTNGPRATFYLIVEGSAIPFQPCPDFNGDQNVNVTDLLALVDAWGTTPSDPGWLPAADLNDDDVINVTDLMLLIANWGACQPPE